MKKNSLLILLALVVIVLIRTLVSSNRPVSEIPAPQIERQQEIKVAIDYGDLRKSVSMSKDYTDSQTAFSILEDVTDQNGIELVTTQYDFGVFVNSIDGFENTEELVWISYINGASASEATDKIELSAGDLVEWKYTKPNY